MPEVQIKVSGSSDMDLLTRKAIIEELENLPTDVLKRLRELQKIPKAKAYLESEMKFQTLKVLLR